MNDKIELMYTIDYTQPKKFMGKSVKGKCWINFKNLINDAENGINDRSLVSMKFTGLTKGNNVSFSTTNPEDPNNPDTAKIIQVYQYILNTNRYEMPSLDVIMDELVHAKNDNITKQDAKEVEDNADAMFIEFMKKINEPETQLLLKSIGQYQMATDTYGWRLSCDNLIRVRTQNPAATFLQTRKQWYEKFNRKVDVNGKRIIVIVPSHDMEDLSLDDVTKTMREIGYPDTVFFNDLSTQQRHHVIIMTRYHLGRGFKPMPFYDVSDTYVMEGKEDIWTNEVGFDNNLTGHLNQRAMDDIDSRIQSGEGDLKDIYNQEEGNVEFLNSALVRGIRNKYPKVKIVETGHAELDFTQNLRNLADYLLETKSKMLRQEHRDTAIEIIVGFVFAFTKLNVQKVVRGLNNQILTDEGYLEVRNRINDIMRLLNDSMIRKENVYFGELLESLPYLKSVDQLLKMIGVNPEDVPSEDELQMSETQYVESINNNMRDSIIENFQKIFNRINNNIYYNERFN